MALSNILNEPRREIIEQVIGTVIVALFIAADFGIVSWLGPQNLGDWIFGIILVPIGMALAVGGLVLLAVGAHALGDAVCEWLADLGYDPRPTQRY